MGNEVLRSMRTLDCDRVDREDVVASYLNGHIPADEAEAFERHYFGCERCWTEVQRAIELRAALKQDAPATPIAGAVPPVRHAARRVWWPWIAAAATIVLVAGIWQANRTSTPPASEGPAVTDVVRSPSDSGFSVQITRSAPGRVQLQWPAQPKAARYVVKISAADGTPVLTREVSTASIDFGPEDLGSHTTQPLVARIETLDVLGAVISSSARTSIPSR